MSGQIDNAQGQSSLTPTLARINHVLVGDFVLGRSTRRYASLAALLTATCIGLATYATDGWIWDDELSLRPDMISTAAALALVAALYARQVVEWAPSVYSLLSLVLNVTITAILVEAILGGGGWSLLGLSMPYLIAFAVVLTWVGLRPLAPVIWALVVIVGLINLQVVSDAMGLWGYAFIILSAAGVLLQLEPNMRHFMPELRYDFTGGLSAPRPISESKS